MLRSSLAGNATIGSSTSTVKFSSLEGSTEVVVSNFAHSLRIHLWAQHLGKLIWSETLMEQVKQEHQIYEHLLQDYDNPQSQEQLKNVAEGNSHSSCGDLKTNMRLLSREQMIEHLECRKEELEELMDGLTSE